MPAVAVSESLIQTETIVTLRDITVTSRLIGSCSGLFMWGYGR